MTTMLHAAFIERFREPNTPYLSPEKVGDVLGYQVYELAERAHVHRSIPSTRPQAVQLQQYLHEMVTVLSVATAMSGDLGRAAFLVRNEPLRVFGYKTAIDLIEEGRADALMAYLDSLAGGAAG
ncbi:TPA: DUF2384 domain-containing protein [Pseudomonas aeruginosa]|jgi:hypothetical protein|uniref:antitoxin Xre/MbcA/ParS toxin-binding domain-containing protein n=1 Tax=Pseudomonas aeruginosa group TaxID=136841 RepID=UPI00066972DE|nr:MULTISPECIES: antitoxin Xre/MbcA/ParS toxin-binding domain-containing protein [Pseudomonas aeruginosa group]KSL70739.1 DUF2384 domain-containing protein [Pseudomonas aeruginosa]KSM83924.1 DUF2384 domain-containing protein [Pseudomonas aeruginosa]MBG6882713.1 DUF2384 domain-containing protein [Pseudomonas aeruginosa]MBV5858631.1 MbcA/ParS/Xre antitoxin family protein [Pseudomonas aeruginosa]MCS7968184.1 MbcA/ParS/Xre antitoxin family protein [Pseudomonas aeruginosa]